MGKLNLLFLLAWGVSGAACATQSFEVRCDKELPPPNITFHTKPITYSVHSNVSARVLSEKGTYSYSSDTLLGMIENKSVVEIEFGGQVLQDNKHAKECMSPQIDVYLRYEPLKVYIARELPEGSCPYRVMYDHEMFHVQVYQEQFPLALEKVKQALNSRLAGRKFYGAIGRAKDTLEQEIDSRWRPLIRSELGKVEKMQRGVDSREEIFRLSNSCFGETARLMGSLY